MAGTSNSRTTGTISDEATAALHRARRVAVPTDAEDTQLAELRGAVVDLATRFEFDVVLYDRSEETWMDHPHPSGPLDRDSIDGEKRPELLEQFDEFVARGVHTTAWIATVPSLTEIVDVIRELDVDLIVVPEGNDGTKLLDRLKSSDPSDIVERVAALNLETPVDVLVRHDDGSITVAEPPER